jgi:hypothetical protein
MILSKMIAATTLPPLPSTITDIRDDINNILIERMAFWNRRHV